MRKRRAPLLLSKSLSALGSQELAQGAAERHDTMLMYLLHDLRLGERCRLLQCLSILSAISSNIVFVLVLAGFRAASYSDESSRRAHLGTSSIPFAPMAEFYGTSVQQKKVPPDEPLSDLLQLELLALPYDFPKGIMRAILQQWSCSISCPTTPMQRLYEKLSRLGQHSPYNAVSASPHERAMAAWRASYTGSLAALSLYVL
jgi:hypothetical protein